jgi:hypothetical protein
VTVYIHKFLTLALSEDEWSASNPRERAHSTHSEGGCVGAIVVLDVLRKEKS